MEKLKRSLGSFAVPLLSILLAFLIGGIIMAALGADPFTAVKFLFQGAFGSKANIGTTLTKATPLMFTSLCACFAYKCGVFNLGGEGQFLMGSIVCCYIATQSGIEGLPAILLCLVGGAVAVFSCLLGTIIGVYASYFKVLDHILMRICDGLIAIPGILLAIALMAALGASNWNVILALTIVYTPSVARVVRSSALVTKNQTYVEAAKVQGATNGRILWKLILPSVISPLTVQASYIFAQAILSEASLSFLGAGIPAPAASWGNILQASKQVVQKASWTVIFPGGALILCVLSLSLLGDGLRDYLDPRTAGRRRK